MISLIKRLNIGEKISKGFLKVKEKFIWISKQVQKLFKDSIKNIIIFFIVVLILYSSDVFKNEKITELWFNFFDGFFSWSVAFVIIFLSFQESIVDLVSRIKTLKVGENEIRFLEKLQKVEHDLSQIVDSTPIETDSTQSEEFEVLASLEPKMAIIKSWLDYERLVREKFKELIEREKIDYNNYKGFISILQIMQVLFRQKIVDQNIYKSFRELNFLRNSIVHGQDIDISTNTALEYDRMLEKLKNYIRDL